MNIRKRITVMSALLILCMTTAQAEPAPEQRLSTSVQSQGGEIAGEASLDELAPLVSSGDRRKTSRGGEQQAAASLQTMSRSPNIEFWIYDASVELFSDWDRDGYYAGIDLTFDADTVYTVAEVYAVIYLSYDYGPWNEYSSTDDFTIFGASGNDAYTIETELLAGYRTGDYDILIELFDTYDGSLVASFGPEDAADLSYLPLEDAERDTPQTTTVVVHEGGGGAFGFMGLAVLLGLTGLRRKRTA